jgi:hypothetical protein
VKSLVTIVLVLLAAPLMDRAVLAHVDGLGSPDPYWQNIAQGSTDGSARIAPDRTAAVGGAAHPWLLRGYVCGLGVLFVVLTVPLLRSLWVSTRRSGP